MQRSRYRLPLVCAALLAVNGQSVAADATDRDRDAPLFKYEASIKERRWEDALVPAQQLVDLAKAKEGEQSLALAEALIRLGGVQYQLKDYPNAEASFITALRIREKQGGALARGLEEPLSGLGLTLAATDRHAEAAEVLERALLVSQRHNGLFDVSQNGLRLQLANSLIESGRGLEAHQQMQNLLQTAETAYGRNDLRFAEIADVGGDWYSRWGFFDIGRSLYRTAIKTIETKAGPNDPRLVNPLRSLGRSFIRELLFTNAGLVRAPANGGFRLLSRTRLPQEGEDAMVRAVRIMEANGARNPTVFRVALIDSGDWYLLKDDRDKALEFYGKALTLPAAGTTETALVGDPLSFPAMLDYEQPQVARRYLERDRSPEKLIERKLTMEFTVSSTGAVVDPRIIESDATERMERETLTSIREALYRPRFENGVPVDTPNVRYQQTFKDLKN
jgi:tetratricopeptide (TPR) repeat protein